MPRIRSTKPEYWKDEELATRFPREARMLYQAMWNIADEHARLRGNPKYIKGEVFPYDDDLDADAIDHLLGLLDKGRKIVRYTVDGMSYIFLPNLAKHQRLEPSKVESRLPGPEEADEPVGYALTRADNLRRFSASNSDTPETDAPSSQLHADEAARRTDEVAPRAEKKALLYVAGSMEHEADTSASDEPMQERSFTLVEPLTDPTFEVGSDADPRWLEFWAAFPRKQGREEAREAWTNHVLGKGTYKGKPIPKTEPEVMLTGVRSYAARIQRERIERKHVKMAQGWINGKRWTDEQAQANEAPEEQVSSIWD